MAAPHEEQGGGGPTRPLLVRVLQPQRHPPEVVGKIIYLRQHYHFGPHKIDMYLKRYHDISISPSGTWRILKPSS